MAWFDQEFTEPSSFVDHETIRKRENAKEFCLIHPMNQKNAKQQPTSVGFRICWMLVLLAISGLTAYAREPVAERPLVFTHVTVIDATGAPAKPDMTVVVSHDRIVAVEKTHKNRIRKDAVIVDATGKFLIPGLWDMHCHLLTNWEYAPVYVANGVTGVRDMGTTKPLPDLAALKKRVDTGDEVGPRFVYAGRIVDGRDSYPGMTLVVATPEEARRGVDMLVDAGADFIKVYESLSPESFYAIAQEARKRGVPFAGHVPHSVTAVEASEAGQKSMEHVFPFLDACSTAGDEFRNVRIQVQMARRNGPVPADLQARFATTYRNMLAAYSSEKCMELGKRFLKNGTWQVPTLAINLPFLMEEPMKGDDPRFRYVSQKVADGWQRQLAGLGKEQIAAARRQAEVRLTAARDLHRAGVRILAGTDAGTNGFIDDVPGFSLHDELSLLVRAGLTPMEALQAATRDAARYLERDDAYGTVEKGKIADLVLLDANPLEDVRNTQKINSVVLNGRLLDKKALEAMLAGAETNIRSK
jgi:imidazolonepropionase-like amidohydrolase